MRRHKRGVFFLVKNVFNSIENRFKSRFVQLARPRCAPCIRYNVLDLDWNILQIGRFIINLTCTLALLHWFPQRHHEFTWWQTFFYFQNRMLWPLRKCMRFPNWNSAKSHYAPVWRFVAVIVCTEACSKKISGQNVFCTLQKLQTAFQVDRLRRIIVCFFSFTIAFCFHLSSNISKNVFLSFPKNYVDTISSVALPMATFYHFQI